MPTALEVAREILWRGSQEEDNDLSNLKLQKLLYYAQGFSLALRGEPCFPEPVVAWLHGPVVVSVYEAYKACGKNPIPAPDDYDPASFPSELRELLDEVYDTYGQFSAWRLREMTHEETPWKSALPNRAIPLDVMREFFLTRLRDA